MTTDGTKTLVEGGVNIAIECGICSPMHSRSGCALKFCSERICAMAIYTRRFLAQERQRAVPCSKQACGLEADQLSKQPTVETSVVVSRIPQFQAGVVVARCCSAELLGCVKIAWSMASVAPWRLASSVLTCAVDCSNRSEMQRRITNGSTHSSLQPLFRRVNLVSI